MRSIHPSLHAALRPTILIEPRRLQARLGLDVILATETFQHTGSFKFRAAMNVALSVPHPSVLTASSGNFGQAMAYACKLVGKSCTVVMPDTSARVKIEAVREHGATVDLIDVSRTSRADRVSHLASRNPDAYVASAYDDDLVIDGNSTLANEILALKPRPDVVIAPVGGGGLSAGLVRGFADAGERAPSVVGAEPMLANDAARSLRDGRLVRNDSEPQTIADGTRTVSLGERNWTVLRSGLETIVEVEEETIREAVFALFALANLKAEPTGALSLAACITNPGLLRGRRVCCVISGGNVDPAVYASLIAKETTI